MKQNIILFLLNMYTSCKCSDFRIPEVTCYKKSQLLEIAQYWNRKNPDSKIRNLQSLNKETLWNELNSRFRNLSEDKWSDYINNPEFKKQFAPLMPNEWVSKPNAWLSDEDIDNVLSSFQNRYRGFHFLQSTPIDFDKRDITGNCKISNLCKYRYEDLANKYSTFGIVFNTDPSTEPGQHWISLFIQLKKGKIYFFDSTSDDPPPEVFKLLKRFQIEGTKYLSKKSSGNKTIKIYKNDVQHQYKNTECGIYCLYFIFFMLSIGDFTKLSSKRINDEEISKFRKVFYDYRK